MDRPLPHIPSDVWNIVLEHLPLSDLMRAREVCRAWCAAADKASQLWFVSMPDDQKCTVPELLHMPKERRNIIREAALMWTAQTHLSAFLLQSSYDSIHAVPVRIDAYTVAYWLQQRDNRNRSIRERQQGRRFHCGVSLPDK